VIHGPVTIGRGDECDIVIPDRKISRQHAQVRPGSEGIVLEDLGSKNGTHHNGALIKGIVTLSDGDTIQIALAQKSSFETDFIISKIPSSENIAYGFYFIGKKI